MILTLKDNASEKQIKEIKERIRQLGCVPEISEGEEKVIILIKGEHASVHKDIFDAYEAVDFITVISEPYKLVSRHWKEKTIVNVDGIQIGGKKIPVAGGPCSVESYESTLKIAEAVKKAGAVFLRGGAYKPRTSPYSFQGMREEGLKILQKVSRNTGLKVITEAMDISQLGHVAEYADVIQIGARNMQNFELLKACGKASKPVLLKRGFSNTVKELLMSAEYVASEGNTDIILCERGIRTFSDHTRFTLDVSSVPAIKKSSNLPVVVDPSHPAGRRELVEPLALASVAAGADGLLIEVHTDPEHAASDGAQTVNPGQFESIMKKAAKIARVVGRQL